MAEIGTPVALGQRRPTHHCERIRVRCRRARQGLTHRFRRADAIGGEDDRRVPAAARRRPSLPPMTRRRSADRTLRCRVLPPARRLRQTSPSRTPKDVNHGPHGLSPAKRRVLGSAGRGHHRLCRTPKASQPQTVGEGHAPLVAVLLASAKADESIPDTKGRESWTPKHFPLQIGIFLGTATGGHDGDRGSLWSAPSSPLASPCWWAKAMPPLWQYFSRWGRQTKNFSRWGRQTKNACTRVGSTAKLLAQGVDSA
jgi:hypothetical protein